MKLVSEPLPGVKVLQPFGQEDARGYFVKPFHQPGLQNLGILFEPREEFFSGSAAGVIRGMHFQVPPAAHQKLVYCLSGSVIDVLLDLRKDSPFYGRAVAVPLSAENRHVIYIPIGVAHGFASLKEGSCLHYLTDYPYSPQHDRGVRWDSFGFDWPFTNPVLSDRDKAFPALAEFESPF